MRLHCLQHVPFEDMANIGAWANGKGHTTSTTHLYEGEKPPALADLDWLVVMGGPMNIYEEDEYPWLAAEKAFIKQAIDHDKIVLGVCLGAQLMADVLGGKVTRNKHKEIGWHTVSLTNPAEGSLVFKYLPRRFMAFHWHGDTFDMPPGATWEASSEACAHQAFQYKKAVGIQFHLETSEKSMERLIENCAPDITSGPYVQKPPDIRFMKDNLALINKTMHMLLDAMESEFRPYH
jgi:GMP synthase-like glutamine amidotransferase